MFSIAQRQHVRTALLEAAAADSRLTGGAITGSAAVGREDQWSDIDLAFGVSSAADFASTLADWTARLYSEHHALHHLDLRQGTWIYRAFLLPGTLQVDLAFAPEEDFRAKAPTFELAFGTAAKPEPITPASSDELIGFGWLYALHARSSLARNKPWQAEYMISGIRDHGLMLACRRHGLPVRHGRGLDELPVSVCEAFADALLRDLSSMELRRTFRVATLALLGEILMADTNLGERLAASFHSLLEGF